MSYGLLYPSNALPWDEPLDYGPVSVQASVSGVILHLNGRVVCHLGPTHAEDHGFTSPGVGLLRLASSLAKGDGFADGLTVPGGKHLWVFSDPQEAAKWRAHGRAEGRAWSEGIDSLLEGF